MTEPTDKELEAFAIEEQFLLFCDVDEFTQIARAVLAKWGTPQPAPAPLSEREAFERDWEKRHAPVPINGRTRDGRYGDSSIQDAWESWQARAALAAQGGKV